MFFASDNTGPAHPSVVEALARANTGYAPAYGADAWTARAVAGIRNALDAPQASVNLMALGTAANAIALATLCDPWDTVFCTPVAHIHEDECNAPEFYTGGAKLTLVGTGEKMTPEALRAAILAEGSRGVHGPQRGPVSITQATEKGTLYTPEEVAALAAVAHDFGLPLHMDGARLANALASLGCSAAEMTWKAGVDALSFGGTKNGLICVEALVMFDPARDWEVQLRRKRGAQLFSKHRFLAAQMLAYLEDGLWLDLAARANANCARLAEGLAATGQARLLYPPQANIVFADMPRSLHQRLLAAGVQYTVWSGDPQKGPADAPLPARLVCDWSLDPAEIDRFLALF
jgi:threonine aldolase